MKIRFKPFQLILICFLVNILMACSYSFKNRYEIKNVWVGNEEVFIYISKTKERHTSSIINIHGSAADVSDENGIVRVQLLANELAKSIDLSDEKLLLSKDVLYASTVLEITEKKGLFFINNIKTNILSTCSKSASKNYPLVVFGSKFIYCDRVFDWVNKVEEKMPTALSDKAQNSFENVAFFSASLATLGFAKIHANQTLSIFEFDENFNIIKSRTEDIDCKNCMMRISTQTGGFYGVGGFMIINDMPSRVSSMGFKNRETRFVTCTIKECKIDEEEKELLKGYKVLSGNPPQYLIFNQSDYYSPIIKFSSKLF